MNISVPYNHLTVTAAEAFPRSDCADETIFKHKVRWDLCGTWHRNCQGNALQFCQQKNWSLLKWIYFIKFETVIYNHFDQKNYHQSKLCLISTCGLYQVLEKWLLFSWKLEACDRFEMLISAKVPGASLPLLYTALLTAVVQAFCCFYRLNWCCLTPQRQSFLKKGVWREEAILCSSRWGWTQALVGGGSMDSAGQIQSSSFSCKEKSMF